jgi:hypothetical protein
MHETRHYDYSAASRIAALAVKLICTSRDSILQEVLVLTPAIGQMQTFTGNMTSVRFSAIAVITILRKLWLGDVRYQK